ncbi:MAG: PilC/PilY family type IV pilus protein [Gammaproteobacteria bacterium]|nr:PilC/PilY family type IV pilus protein [Gammaproteobacteria bacterium]
MNPLTKTFTNDAQMIKRATWSLLSLLSLLIIFSGVSRADDIEIYVSTDDQAFTCEAPNILFVIDTSGSMGANIMTQVPWDPATTYAGCYDSSRVYYAATATPPDCDSLASFPKTANFCQAAAGTEYTGLLQMWNNDLKAWEKLPADGTENSVECAADEGIHGNGLNSKTWAIDGIDGPWSADPTNRIAWGTNATSATLFDGNWLNWQDNPPVVTTTRLDVVKDVVNSTLDSMSDVNVGVMEFNPSEGGPVIEAISDLNTSREQLKTTINALRPGGQTPISETLYEAGQYLAGRAVDYGDVNAGNRSVAESRLGNSLDSARYLSPLDSEGQNNYIVLLTDGEPSDDNSANRKIESLPGYQDLVGETCDDDIDGDCLDKMSSYLFKADLRDDVDEQQNVITHTIGFTINLELLQETAERGGGKYFVADDTATLTRALSNLAQDFTRTASLLAPAAIPVNTFDRSQRFNDVYLSLFKPASTYHWPGNLKKYRLASTSNGLELVGADGRNALTETGDFISESAVSFWSAPLNDGDDVEQGGAASQLTAPVTRKLLTNVSNDLRLTSLDKNNASITAAMLGAPDAERDTVIDWAQGVDVRDINNNGDTTDARLAIGDPLHVQPITAVYGDTADSPDAIIFVATNDGYLHAIDSQTGKELWSFVPQRLLARLYELSLNQTAQNKQYGLDGELTLVTSADGRPETLLLGMRRGGEAVYAIDVSVRGTPKLKWIIDSTQADFLDLGQTWSKPVVSAIDINGTRTKVAIFGGGYDSGQDNRTFRRDTKGNAVYIVDLERGSLIWSAGNPAARSDHNLKLDRMSFSIPAGMRVLDLNADGLADRMYVGDMGGQVWRFDINNGARLSGLVDGGALASLGNVDSAVDAAINVRRFYNTPDVASIITNDSSFLVINIGSGYRAHPLDTDVRDEFYSIRDRNGTTIKTEDYETVIPLIRRVDLLDITTLTEPTLAPSSQGWRLGMVQDAGEKILGESLTINNTTFFNSYAPSRAGNSCVPGAGTNRSYRIGALNGRPLTNLDQSVDPTNLTPRDRFVESNWSAPLSAPTLGPNDFVCSGLECFGGDDPFQPDGNAAAPDKVNKTYWYPVQSAQ